MLSYNDMSMSELNKKKFRKNEIISASEIGQYYFCSKAWYLQKCGYKPDSKFLDIGTKKHKEIGEIIVKTRQGNKKSKIYAIAGYLILISAILMIIFGVIL